MKTVTISKKRLLVGAVEASLRRLSRLTQALSAPLTEIARAHLCISSFPSLMPPCSDELLQMSVQIDHCFMDRDASTAA
ncbi:hypothetical protein QN277_026829 [Acacia crassicarpa]|uniref:Uncharacterized protein n=1 Tax=Acacia crassicarpa TaxID=499986 RepID=A0AAE1J8M7_9FABA|nr:hypothetical protein QN277_026829 [Acacia crassicarpa]